MNTRAIHKKKLAKKEKPRYPLRNFKLKHVVIKQMTGNIELQSFGKWRRRLWPFHRSEFKKLFPLLLIKLLISVNFTILAALKDTAIVTAPGSGAEVISVLKGWVVLPAAMLIAILYSKLSNILNKRMLFYTMIGGFLVVIFLYAFVLYPNADTLAFHKSSDWLVSKLGVKFEHWVAVYRYWMHSLLFVTAELWGTVIILVLFWGFANDITSVDEAKRSYNIYIAAGDLGAFSIGPLVYFIEKQFFNLDFSYTAQTLLSIVLISGLAIIAIYWWMNKYVLTDAHFFNADEYKVSPKKQKEKLSLRQGFRHLAKSKYLLGIAVLVVGYGFVVNMIEITWKATAKLAYPNSADYLAFTSNTTSCVGLIGFVISLLLGSNVIRKFGWRYSAQLTPVLVGSTGVIFLSFILFKDSLSSISPLFGLSPLVFLAFFGAFQNVVSKVTKYAFFDPTKEMAYIPLDEEAKLKGKAAIDVVGSRLGKSGSSWIQVALIDLVGTGSILSVTHILLPIIVAVTVFWIISVRSLSTKFEEKHEEQKMALKGV
jgi:AAA family ATP:ADP antiporter